MVWKRVTIARLELRNFKKFYGVHHLDLQPESQSRPLVLIGGDNGRGKTSIHEAINYALYEDGDLPGIVTRPNYLKAISDRLNRRALDEGRQDYSVALDLVVSDGTAERVLRIERAWDADIEKRRAVRSRLSITEGGRRIDWIDEDSPAAHQEFVRSIIPPRVAPFFFFDGERIQQFADDSGQERGMIEAVEDILHIGIYKSLRDDLKKYVVDEVEKHEIRKQESDDFHKLQEDSERIESELEQKRDRQADIAREMEELHARGRRAGEELLRIASPHASRRDELLNERARLERELAEAKTEVEKGFEPLPLLLAGSLCRKLITTLREEGRTLSSPGQLEELRGKLASVEQQVFVSPEPRPPERLLLSDGQSEVYRALFQAAANREFGFRSIEPPPPRIHDIGDSDRQRIIERLAVVRRHASALRDALDRRERLSNEYRDVDTKLASTSDDPHVLELIKEKQETDELIGTLTGEENRLRAEIQRLEADAAKRQRQIEERQRTRAATTEAKKVVRRAQEARSALDVFIKKLGAEKLRLLRDRFGEMYGRLRKPEDPIKSVAIDRETWQIILKDERGRPLERAVFSAGMKEMYALSLLWALSRASGRDLPIVIDTPVGRLDTTNRRALFEKYLPNAGHQVIVLSTDTEVDVQWAKRLEEHVSRQYRLDYEVGADSTVIRPGYFF
jgi:DNA sulfur modification protein DndD